MWEQVVFAFVTLFSSATHQSWVELALKFFPFVVLLEAPFFLLVCAGMVKYGLREHRPYLQRERYPRVSCVITCYSEGDDVRKTIQSLAQQIYPGFIEIIAVVDGAVQNESTLRAPAARANCWPVPAGARWWCCPSGSAAAACRR